MIQAVISKPSKAFAASPIRRFADSPIRHSPIARRPPPMPEPIVVSVTRHLAVSAQTVFDAWLDPSVMRKWLFATETGEVVRAENDARVGGKFVITDRRNGEDVEHNGVWLAIDRPRQLEFTYVAGDPDGDSSRVIVHIVPTESGCEVSVTHVMDPKWGDFRDHASRAWTGMLARLASVIEPQLR
jgi:uncharacterized protein YndB with AHSA1/START domain